MWTIVKALLGPIWTWLAGAAIVTTVIGGIYTKGYVDGKANVRALWDAAIAQNIKDATTTRGAVDRDLSDHPPTPDELCKSQWNRSPC